MLPSYNECLEICQKSESFYESKFVIDGYPISIFNYRLCQYQDFIENNAFELRGLTFVFNQDLTIFERYPLFEKFFNLNENESVKYEDLVNLKIKSTYLKEDGSIISFIKLPNGRIVAKSKNSFESDQALMAQNFFENNQTIKEFVDSCLINGQNPIFELVSPRNRIVVNYEKTDLILLAVRNKDGDYQNLDSHNLSKPLKSQQTLDDLIQLKSQLEGIEGWVVEFENGKRVKIKTDWYFSLHRILTDYSGREDYLIDMILDEKLDDLLSQIPNDSESYLFVKSIETKTLNKIKKLKSDCDDLKSNFNGDFKDFAINFNNNPLFKIVIQIIKGKDEIEVIKEFIRKKTYRLNEAREWLGDDYTY